VECGGCQASGIATGGAARQDEDEENGLFPVARPAAKWPSMVTKMFHILVRLRKKY